MNVHIESAGNPNDFTVKTTDTGTRIKGVRAVLWDAKFDGIPVATIEIVCPAITVEADATLTTEYDGKRYKLTEIAER